MALLLVLVLGIVVADFANQLQAHARFRMTGGYRPTPDRVQVLSAEWLERDLYEIKMRLSRSDGQLLFGPYRIRLTDPEPGGFGEISAYSARTLPSPPPSSTIDVVAYQRLPEAPKGPLTLRIDG